MKQPRSFLTSQISRKQTSNVCRRKQQEGCLTDHVLLIDYLLAFQYFRLFRWESDQHCLLDVKSAECKQRILNAQLVQDYILELEGVLPPSLFRLAVHLLVVQTTRKWLEDDLEQRAPDLPELAAEDLNVPGLQIVVCKLQILLLNKLEDEQSRNCYLGSIADEERSDVFTETDRVVQSLLDVKLDAGESHVSGLGTTTMLRTGLCIDSC